MCGDATDAADMRKLMHGECGVRADIVFTSPPYNAGYLGIAGKPKHGKKYLHSEDSVGEDEYVEFLQKNLDLLFEHSHEIFYNISMLAGNKTAIAQILCNNRQHLKDVLYWFKTNALPPMQPGIVANDVEMILVFGDDCSRRFRHPQFERGKCRSYVKGSNARHNPYCDIHKATFPLYLPKHHIENFTAPGDTVLDPFGGTGTTLIACEELDRKCRMMEIDPTYCDIIIERWEKLTGERAEKITE
jgi:DNA modification methylase